MATVKPFTREEAEAELCVELREQNDSNVDLIDAGANWYLFRVTLIGGTKVKYKVTRNGCGFISVTEEF